PGPYGHSSIGPSRETGSTSPRRDSTACSGGFPSTVRLERSRSAIEPRHGTGRCAPGRARDVRDGSGGGTGSLRRTSAPRSSTSKYGLASPPEPTGEVLYRRSLL